MIVNFDFLNVICRIWGDGDACIPSAFKKIMPTGRNIALLPGGFEEATLYKRGRHRLYLSKRKGFIKYALQYGYNVQPVYVFGEEQTFWTVKTYPTLMLWLNRFHIPGVLFYGRFLFLPDWNANIIPVVGNVIKFPHIPEPSPADVDKHHALFIAAMQTLFDKYKGKYASQGNDAKLELL